MDARTPSMPSSSASLAPVSVPSAKGRNLCSAQHGHPMQTVLAEYLWQALGLSFTTWQACPVPT